MAHVETRTFKNLDLDCILGNNVNNTLQMGNRHKEVKKGNMQKFYGLIFQKIQ